MKYKYDNDNLASIDTNKIGLLVRLLYIEIGLIPFSNEKDSICKASLSLTDEEQRQAKRKFRKLLRSCPGSKSKLKRLSKSAKRSKVYNKIYTEVLLKYNYIDGK